MSSSQLLCLVPIMTLATMSSALASGRTQARSMVITTRGIVATSQTLASQAGAQILARGGSAIDAAIAANAVMGVVEPMSNGIGGDLFAIRRDAATGKITGINASGWAPQALTRELLLDKGYDQMPEQGILSVTVPGCVEGWKQLHRRYGRLPWPELFQPAVYYAEHGFPVTEWIHAYWRSAVKKLSASEEARRIFLPGGKAPAVGEVFRNPLLADTLRQIALHGAEPFYRGAIARAILATSKRLGGVLAPADLADYEAEWVEPITATYRGWKVYELPPNGQGMAALEMLNIMERFPLTGMPPDSAETLHLKIEAQKHLKIEAQKLAYQDLQRYLGDPRFSRIPVGGLLSKEYAARRRIEQLRAGQYISEVLHVNYDGQRQGSDRLHYWVDEEARTHLETEVFGKRILVTNRDEWSSEEIVRAYRGQHYVEAVFRQCKDDEHFAIRPQFHWTDQKIQVHTFICLLALLLARVVEREARRRQRTEGLAGLLDLLATVRLAMVLHSSGKKGGRPRTQWQLETGNHDAASFFRQIVPDKPPFVYTDGSA